MTIVCMCCGRAYREACPKCETTAQPLHLRDGSTRFGCSQKRCTVNTFPKGDGGEKHGICEACAQITDEQRDALVKSRLEQAIDNGISHEEAQQGAEMQNVTAARGFAPTKDTANLPCPEAGQVMSCIVCRNVFPAGARRHYCSRVAYHVEALEMFVLVKVQTVGELKRA